MPAIHLFCLPFSGGNIYSYRGLEQHIARFITLVPFDLPGHGKRMAEPLLTEIHAIVDDVFVHIKDNLTTPYALYGHSMGTLLGYLVACKIVQEHLPAPLHLFVSGRQGPSEEGKEKDWHVLPDEEFTQKVLSYGGIPREVAAEKDLMDLFVPIMKADFKALSTYSYQPTEPLDIPITVMIGSGEEISHEEALKWQEVTTHPVSLKVFSGKHFFIFNHLQAIGQLISTTLERQVAQNI